MDARTQKRLETVRVIRNKKWFTQDVPGPDPWDASVSTRFWRYSVRVWDKALKENYYRGEPADSPRQPCETAVKHHPCYLVRAPLDDALPGQTPSPCSSSAPSRSRVPAPAHAASREGTHSEMAVLSRYAAAARRRLPRTRHPRLSPRQSHGTWCAREGTGRRAGAAKRKTAVCRVSGKHGRHC